MKYGLHILSTVIIASALACYVFGGSKAIASNKSNKALFDEPAGIESPESSNIIELESKKFRNITTGNQVLTVYKVYGHKVLVVEGEKDDVAIIKLD